MVGQVMSAVGLEKLLPFGEFWNADGWRLPFLNVCLYDCLFLPVQIFSLRLLFHGEYYTNRVVCFIFLLAEKQI